MEAEDSRAKDATSTLSCTQAWHCVAAEAWLAWCKRGLSSPKFEFGASSASAGTAPRYRIQKIADAHYPWADEAVFPITALVLVAAGSSAKDQLEAAQSMTIAFKWASKFLRTTHGCEAYGDRGLGQLQDANDFEKEGKLPTQVATRMQAVQDTGEWPKSQNESSTQGYTCTNANTGALAAAMNDEQATVEDTLAKLMNAAQLAWQPRRI
ncbi:MAG: hypothetical protein ACPGUV_09685 [Polyangiales bacterium]